MASPSAGEIGRQLGRLFSAGSAVGLTAFCADATRSQDQLHLHMGCLIPALRARLFDFARWLRTGKWTEASQLNHGSASLWVSRVIQPNLSGVEPFRLGAQALRDKVRKRAELMFFVAAFSCRMTSCSSWRRRRAALPRSEPTTSS